MANLLAGFVEGFANNQVDQIQERRKLENEEKKAKMLSDLQRETAQANFLFEENFKKSNRVDPAMSTIDPTTGKITQVAQDGTVLSTRDMNPSEVAAHQRKERGEQLGLDNIQSQIDGRVRDDARQDRVATAQIGSYNRSNRDTPLDGSAVSAAGIGAALVTSYGDTVEEMTGRGVSRIAIESMAARVVANVKARNPKATGPELEQAARSEFVQSLRLLNTGMEKNPQDPEAGFQYNPTRAMKGIDTFKKKQGIK